MMQSVGKTQNGLKLKACYTRRKKVVERNVEDGAVNGA